MENKTQDPKYIIIDGQLANAKTREFIPKDEPVFIIRAKDHHAIAALIAYQKLCSSQKQRDCVQASLSNFYRYSTENPEGMSEPD